MPDEPIMIRGGSLEIECDGGRKSLLPIPGGKKHRHPSQNGTITKVEITDGDGRKTPVNINVSNGTTIEIHYVVP